MTEPPTLAELGMPPSFERLAAFHQGMVLFTGPAGCGKSSTMAALVRAINDLREDLWRGLGVLSASSPDLGADDVLQRLLHRLDGHPGHLDDLLEADGAGQLRWCGAEHLR